MNFFDSMTIYTKVLSIIVDIGYEERTNSDIYLKKKLAQTYSNNIVFLTKHKKKVNVT